MQTVYTEINWQQRQNKKTQYTEYYHSILTRTFNQTAKQLHRTRAMLLVEMYNKVISQGWVLLTVHMLLSASILNAN